MTSMTNYQKGDLLLVRFPFADVGQSKRRPAMIVADTGDGDVLVARVTTQGARDAFDVELVDWQLATSVVRLHKLATINKSLVGKKLRKIAESDRANVATVLAQLCGGW